MTDIVKIQDDSMYKKGGPTEDNSGVRDPTEQITSEAFHDYNPVEDVIAAPRICQSPNKIEKLSVSDIDAVNYLTRI